jgi:amino acid transporter
LTGVGVAAALLLGTLFGTLFGLTWILRRAPRESLVTVLPRITRVLGPNLEPPPDTRIRDWGDMPPFALTAFACAAVYTGLAWGSGFEFALGLIASVAMIAAVVLTIVGLIHLNVEMKRWDARESPAGWDAVVARWLAVNTVRTVLVGVAFGAMVVALAYGE